MSQLTAYDLDPEVQRRRQEACDCRKMGYITLLVALTLIGTSALLGLAFHIPGDQAIHFWLMIPGLIGAIFGLLAVAVGAAEGY